MTVGLLLCALGLLCWPPRIANVRLSSLVQDFGCLERLPARWFRLRLRYWWLVVLLCIGVLLLSPAVVLGILCLLGAGIRNFRWSRECVANISRLDAMAEALRMMAAELRAGATPVTAAELVASHVPSAADLTRVVAQPSQYGIGGTGSGADGGTAMKRLAMVWPLTERYGLPMAAVLAAVHRDFAVTARQARQTWAKMAGPRSSALVLALLPVLGIALGELMGAQPIRVLTTTSIGQVAFLIGCALIFTGVMWSIRLIEGAMSP